MDIDIVNLTLEAKCLAIQQIITSVLDDIRLAARELEKNCSNLDTMKEYVESTSPELEFENSHPIVKALINALATDCDIDVKVKTMEQIYFASSVSS